MSVSREHEVDSVLLVAEEILCSFSDVKILHIFGFSREIEEVI